MILSPEVIIGFFRANKTITQIFFLQGSYPSSERVKGRGFRQLPTKDKSLENILMNSNDYIAVDSSNAMIRELKRKWREYEEKVRKRNAVNILYFHMHTKGRL